MERGSIARSRTRGSIALLVPLEEVPVGGQDTVIETVVGKGLEDGGTHVEVRVSTAGAAVDDDGVDGLAVGLDPNSLATVVAVVPVVQTLADGDNHVVVIRLPSTFMTRGRRQRQGRNPNETVRKRYSQFPSPTLNQVERPVRLRRASRTCVFSASATGAALTIAKEARMETMVILVSPNILYRGEVLWVGCVFKCERERACWGRTVLVKCTGGSSLID